MRQEDRTTHQSEAAVLKDMTNDLELGEVSLSLTLHAPDQIFVADTKQPGRVLLHLEIRNRTNLAWEGDTPNGPILEILVVDSKGEERSRQTRLCPMLAYPTRLEAGRGFNLPLSVVFPEIDPDGESFRLEVRFVPGREKIVGQLNIKPRTLPVA